MDLIYLKSKTNYNFEVTNMPKEKGKDTTMRNILSELAIVRNNSHFIFV